MHAAGAAWDRIGADAAAAPVCRQRRDPQPGSGPRGPARSTARPPERGANARRPRCHRALAPPPTGKSWACCPRSALKRVLASLKERHGLTIKAGFELEFVLLKDVGPGGPGALAGTSWAPVDNATYSSTSGLDAQCEGAAQLRRAGFGGLHSSMEDLDAAGLPSPNFPLTRGPPPALLRPLPPVLDAMVQALMDMGIGVVQWHKEAAPGQFEIATAPGGCGAAPEAASGRATPEVLAAGGKNLGPHP
jgi:glutamine synthetase